jgi:K+-sensing histidine kinase KdpD
MIGLTLRRLLGVLLAAVLVAATTGVLRVADADLTVAALVYVVVVVATTLLGSWAGAAGAVLCYLSLSYWFVPEYASFSFTRSTSAPPSRRASTRP